MNDLSIARILNRQESFGVQSADPAKPSLDIAFGIDERYARYMGVLMTSLIAHNVDCFLIFHVFTDSIRNEDRQRLSQLAEQFSVSIHIYYINPASVQNLPAANHYSPATYYRLLIPAILQGKITRLLYLDSDIICISKLTNISEIPMGNTIAAIVPDVPAIVEEKVKELHLTHKNYFNAGVMLMDIEKWNLENISEKVLTVLTENIGKFSLQDQDALNIVLDGKTALLPPTWNQVYNMGQMTQDLLPGTMLLHYAGSIKPWRLSGRHPISRHYRDFENRSPWAGSPLLPPAGYKEMEVYSRLSFRERDFATGLRWYWRYLTTKFL